MVVQKRLWLGLKGLWWLNNGKCLSETVSDRHFLRVRGITGRVTRFLLFQVRFDPL